MPERIEKPHYIYDGDVDPNEQSRIESEADRRTSVAQKLGKLIGAKFEFVMEKLDKAIEDGRSSG